MRNKLLLLGMTILFSSLFLGLPVLASNSFQTDVNYIVDTINLSSQSHLVKVITIQNLLNTSINIGLTSDNSNIEIPLSSMTLDPNSNISATIIISSIDSGVINGNIYITKDSEELTIPVIVSVVASEEETLEESLSVFPTSKIMEITQGTVSSMPVTIKNLGDSPVILETPFTQGTTTTQSGERPIYLKDFSSGSLPPGEQTTLIIGVTAEGVEIGTYSPYVILGYSSPGGETKQKEIHFTITVKKGVTPIITNKSMVLNIYPTNPEVGSLVYISVTDEEENIIPASISIKHDDCYGNRIEEFNYKFPFILESGNYTITADSEGYTSSIKHINVAELSTKIEVPDNPTTDSRINIRYLTDNNILVETGTINVNNKSYTGGSASVYLDEGTYTITANAPGYVEQTKDITVTKILKIIIQNTTLEPNQEQMIRFNKNCSWELRTGGRTLDYGSGDKFLFKQEKAGVYDIYAEDKKLGSVLVESKEWNLDLSLLSEYWWVIILVIGIILIYKKKNLQGFRKKKRVSVGYAPATKGPVRDLAGIKED